MIVHHKNITAVEFGKGDIRDPLPECWYLFMENKAAPECWQTLGEKIKPLQAVAVKEKCRSGKGDSKGPGYFVKKGKKQKEEWASEKENL